MYGKVKETECLGFEKFNFPAVCTTIVCQLITLRTDVMSCNMRKIVWNLYTNVRYFKM